ncbi:hypothetical protein BH09ACT8_BH09ACT8_21120 [soil metagenome]
MTVHVRRKAAMIAVGIGIAAGSGHAVAWADTGQRDSAGISSSSHSSPASKEPKKSSADHRVNQGESSTATPNAKSLASPKTESPRRQSTTAQSIPLAPQHVPGFRRSQSTRPDSAPKTSPLAALATGPDATAPTTPALITPAMTPSDPGPLSPIAQIAALPGIVVNTVLQVLDLTVSVNGPHSPLNWAPVDEALFAVFRRIEDAVGFYDTPAVQPVPPTEIYTGPTDTKTPTVTQFLNAAAAGYVLGGTPGGLKPFTVDGVPMTSTNILSGESAQVWVTPDKQIIISYQGTTGGTNLLFNPLIAISQIFTDMQVIFTDTTPQAFTDSLVFEQQVEAEAAKQGYSTDDIFLTGHSLGGWEAEYVAQQTGLGGIGFESPGINTTVPGNGINSGFINVETYGDAAAYFATDLPALQPFMPAYVPGGGTKPHYGSIVMIGDPNAVTPLFNAAALWGQNPVADLVFAVVTLGNFFEHHLPGMQAYNLGVSPDPGVVPWLGSTSGPIDADWADLTIPALQIAASAAGRLITA